MKKKLFIKNLIIKNTKRKKYIKDKALNKFLFQHLVPKKLDFTKIQNCLLNRLANEENILEGISTLNEISEIGRDTVPENNMPLFLFPQRRRSTSEDARIEI